LTEPSRRGPWLLLAALHLAALALVVVWVTGDDPPASQPSTTIAAQGAGGDEVALPGRDVPATPILPPTDDPPAGPPVDAAGEVPGDGAPGAEPLTILAVDEAFEPVANALVEIQARDAPLAPPRFLDQVWRTDGAGRCRLRAPPGATTLYASDPLAGTSGLWALRLLASRRNARGEVVVVLRAPATLRGHVLHADDRPAPRALVHLRALPGAPRGREVDAVRTDGAGAFSVRLDAGTAWTVAAALGSLRTHEERLRLGEGRPGEVTLRFPGRWTASGVLVDADGEPVAGGAVTLWRHFPGFDLLGDDVPPEDPHRVETETDAEGAFRFDLPRPGGYVLVGSAGDAPPSDVAEIHVDDGAPHGTAWLRLPRTAAITGRVVDAAGAPLAGVAVRARPAHLYSARALEYGPTVWGRYGQARDDTAADGRFTLAPLHPAGTYIVFCRPDGSRPDHKLVVKGVPAGTEDLELVVTDLALRRGYVAGTVVADATGLPVADFLPRLVIELDGRVVDTEQPAVRDGDGRFRIEGLAPGYRYALRIEAEGYGAVELPWWEASYHGHHVEARLPGLGGLEEEVRDPSGTPLAPALVELTGGSPGFDVVLRDSSHTDELGRARFGGLAPGRYEVTARWGGETARTEVDVAAEATARARLTLAW